jgi:hypothetical protein
MKRNFVMIAVVLAALAVSSVAARAQSDAVNKSFSSCSANLCIDAPPEGKAGLDGSGGWGWNSKTNAPVTKLYVGKPASFTVTVLQPSSLPLCGQPSLTITLTYSSWDVTLNTTDSGGTVGVNPFDRGGVETFTYSGDFLCHGDQSVAFTFTPVHSTDTAMVTATVSSSTNSGAEQASETFPVEITKK